MIPTKEIFFLFSNFCPPFSDFQPFVSQDTHKLITKILQHIEKHYFADLTKIGIIMIYKKYYNYLPFCCKVTF